MTYTNHTQTPPPPPWVGIRSAWGLRLGVGTCHQSSIGFNQTNFSYSSLFWSLCIKFILEFFAKLSFLFLFLSEFIRSASFIWKPALGCSLIINCGTYTNWMRICCPIDRWKVGTGVKFDCWQLTSVINQFQLKNLT